LGPPVTFLSYSCSRREKMLVSSLTPRWDWWAHWLCAGVGQGSASATFSEYRVRTEGTSQSCSASSCLVYLPINIKITQGLGSICRRERDRQQAWLVSYTHCVNSLFSLCHKGSLKEGGAVPPPQGHLSLWWGDRTVAHWSLRAGRCNVHQGQSPSKSAGEIEDDQTTN